jgi:gluconolactonase
MKSSVTFVAVLCFLGYVTALGQQGPQGGGQAQQAPPAETVAPNIPGVVAGGTKVQVFKVTSGGTEGPVAMPDGSVLFTETSANRVWKIDKADKVSLFLENTSGALALGFDSKGRLIATGQRKISVIYPKSQEGVLADNVNGEPLGLPNDLVVSKNGGVYFTDPGPNAEQLKEGRLPTEPAVLYIPLGGKAIKVADFMTSDRVRGRPNGIQLSPDEKILYVNNSWGEYLLAYDIQADGALRNRRNFGKYELVKRAETVESWIGPAPGTLAASPVQISDGLASDNEGRLYVANQSVLGVQVFSPQGQSLGTIPLGGRPQNLAFAGSDKKTLYIVGRGYAYKVQMLAQGPKGRAK